MYVGNSTNCIKAKALCLKSVIVGAPQFSLACRLLVMLTTNGVLVMLYASPKDVNQKVIKRLIATLDSPFVVGFVSTMLDVRLSKGLTIGLIFASEKYVCPDTVGANTGYAMHVILVTGLYKDDLTSQQKNKCSPF